MLTKNKKATEKDAEFWTKVWKRIQVLRVTETKKNAEEIYQLARFQIESENSQLTLGI